MSLILWIDKADDFNWQSEARWQSEAYYPIITQLLYIVYVLTLRCSEKVELVLDNKKNMN